MTTLTHTRTALQEIIAADLDPAAPAYVVRKASTTPTPPPAPRPLTWRDAIAIDTRGEAAFHAPCVDCGTNVRTFPLTLVRDEDDQYEIDFVPLCTRDREIRDTWNALWEQRDREMARRRTMAGAR